MSAEPRGGCPERVWPGGPDCELAAGHPGQHFRHGFEAPPQNDNPYAGTMYSALFELARTIQANLVEAIDTLDAINSKLGAGFVPVTSNVVRAERDDLVLRIDSVEVEDNSRGTVAKAKAYGATMQQAEDEAIASIQRIRARLSTMGQLQAAAEDLAKALVGLLLAIQDHIDDESITWRPPTEAIAMSYQALTKAGVEMT